MSPTALEQAQEQHQHYFTREPASASAPSWVEATLRGIPLRFATDAGVFARSGVDPGTRLLAETMALVAGDWVCDLGCGYGVLGVVASRTARHVILVDINARAVALTQQNLRGHGAANAEVLQTDGLAAFRDASFDAIVCNPPIRAGNAVVFRLFEESLRALKPGGKFWMVAQTKQGAKSLRKKLAAMFRSVEALAIKGGYRVFVGIK